MSVGWNYRGMSERMELEACQKGLIILEVCKKGGNILEVYQNDGIIK